MNRGQVAARVAENKRKHPERYCPEPRCLWATGGKRCPRHGGEPSPVVILEKLEKKQEGRA